MRIREVDYKIEYAKKRKSSREKKEKKRPKVFSTPKSSREGKRNFFCLRELRSQLIDEVASLEKWRTDAAQITVEGGKVIGGNIFVST